MPRYTAALTGRSMSSDSIVDRLAALPLFQSVPRSELEWLAAHGEVRTYEVGAIPNRAGEQIDEMIVLVAGRAGLYAEAGGSRRKILEFGAGGVGGVLPNSGFQRAPVTSIVEEEAIVFTLHQ